MDPAAQPRAHVRRICGYRRSTFMCFSYVGFYIFYLVSGAIMFSGYEAPIERVIRLQIAQTRADFLQEHSCVSNAALESLIQEIVKANDRGVSAVNNVSGEPNWSFGQSLFFSSTVITTIGYGHVTPLSKEGKIFCLIYASLGIPLTLVLLSAVVERLMIPATLFLQFLNSRLGHLYQPFSIRLLHFAIIVAILVTLFILLPAMVFASIEPGWDYLDSLYYCFISLTTVGLGDYIPGDAPEQQYRPLYKLVTTGYLLVGLAFMMLALTIFYDIPQLNVGLVFMLRSDERTTDPEKVRLKTSAGSLGPNSSDMMISSEKTATPSPDESTPLRTHP